MSESIVKEDPNSIIIIMSDHGMRDHMKWGIKDEDVVNTLNMVYFRGEKIENYNGLCAVNSWRLILNKAFGFSLPMLDEKEYRIKYPLDKVRGHDH